VALGLVGPSLGLRLGWTILAASLGVLFGTIFLALHGSQGPALGLPQMIQSRAQLGYRGVIVILFAAVFTFVGYNVVDTVLIDAGFHTLFGWNATATGLGVGVLATVLAVWGHDWLHIAFRILFWLSLPLWLILTVGMISGHAGGQADPGLGFSVTAFVTVFTIGASYNITYAPIVSDYTRYLPQQVSSRPLILTIYGGAAISAIWMIALGAWLGARFGVADTLVGVHDATNNVVPLAGSVLVIISGLALVATMGLNTYSATLTTLTTINCFHPMIGTWRRVSRATRVCVTGADPQTTHGVVAPRPSWRSPSTSTQKAPSWRNRPRQCTTYPPCRTRPTDRRLACPEFWLCSTTPAHPRPSSSLTRAHGAGRPRSNRSSPPATRSPCTATSTRPWSP
jgi:purine-cytosine permease-like protein